MGPWLVGPFRWDSLPPVGFLARDFTTGLELTGWPCGCSRPELPWIVFDEGVVMPPQ
jgi:hypothetical protein